MVPVAGLLMFPALLSEGREARRWYASLAKRLVWDQSRPPGAAVLTCPSSAWPRVGLLRSHLPITLPPHNAGAVEPEARLGPVAEAERSQLGRMRVYPRGFAAEQICDLADVEYPPGGPRGE